MIRKYRKYWKTTKRMNNKNELNFIKGGRSFYTTIILCLLVFFIAVAVLIAAFNSLMLSHDEKLSDEICNLVSEKMNSAILFMTDSVNNVSSVLSTQDFDSPEEIYDVLKTYKKGNIVSVGFIDEEDKMYLSETEAMEFEKWNLLDTAKKADPVSISFPYRSTKLGQPVISFFAKFDYGDSKHGYMFMTYLFSTLQDVAETDSLSNEIEIWLMDAKSANIIQCVGYDSHASGSWANAYLAMSNIDSTDKDSYDEWYAKMLNGEPSATVSYGINGTLYSQCCSAIEYMQGWYVVVRIPGNALSATMSTFRNYVLRFLVVLLGIVIILISLLYISGKRENNILSQLSINDPLTGVLNRRAFDLAADKMLGETKESVFMFFDIDYFKQVNDTFGHDTGDKLLKEFSGILKKYFAETGLVSRFGGDEFVVLTKTESVETLNDKLKQITEDVHSIRLDSDSKADSGDFMISFSAGVAAYPKHADSIEELQKCADIALYTVKERGRNAYLWYSPAYMKKPV